MKRHILTLAALAALTLGAAPGAHAASNCRTVTIPGSAAVYKTTVIPAVTVVEYEFAHRPDATNGNGQGPANKWQTDPNWNAESNPNSVGWVATGNTRVTVLEVEKSIVELVTPAVPDTTREECYEVPDQLYPSHPDPGPDTPPADGNPAPVAQEPAPVAAPVAPVPVPAAPLAVVPAQPVEALPPAAAPAPVVSAADLPEELAYTGAADWVLPAGLGLLVAGSAAVMSRRFINPTK